MKGVLRVDEDLRRRALKRPDAWWAVLVIDPVALPVLALLVRLRWVTPLRLTVLGAGFGAAAVASFGTGHLLLGAIMFELRFFLDCLDGKLARVRELTSSRGAFLDLTTDVILISSAMAALGWHLSRTAAPVPLELTAACTVACLILFWLILYDLDHPRVHPPRTPSKESGLARWLRHHRLRRLPGTIEVETGLLFLAPLSGDPRLLFAAFVAAGAYYVVASAHLFLKLFRRSSPPSPSRPDDPQPAR